MLFAPLHMAHMYIYSAIRQKPVTPYTILDKAFLIKGLACPKPATNLQRTCHNPARTLHDPSLGAALASSPRPHIGQPPEACSCGGEARRLKRAGGDQETAMEKAAASRVVGAAS